MNRRLPLKTLLSVVGCLVALLFSAPAHSDSFFDIEYIQLDLSGNLDGSLVMIRESPTLASTGKGRIMPDSGGGFRLGSFFDIFTEISYDRGESWIPSSGPGPGSSEMTLMPSPSPGTFDTELLQLNLSGDFNTRHVMIRESPTLQSTGRTMIEDNPGGGHLISSFFDIFTEISVDGGQTWESSGGSTTATIRAVSVPEPSVLLLLGAGLAALAGLGRRSRG